MITLKEIRYLAIFSALGIGFWLITTATEDYFTSTFSKIQMLIAGGLLLLGVAYFTKFRL